MRDDITNNLVHLTKGTNADKAKYREEAARNFHSIVKQRKLVGGSGFIRGSYKCVCFSEAPIGKLSHIIASGGGKDFKYQPYGVMLSKQWLFEKGGRPAIYGPYDEFEKLPEEMRYRHVRFYLGDYKVDHSWEREWRIRTDELLISPQEVTLVVPDRISKEVFQEAHGSDWHFLVLSDIGVDITPL